MDLWATLGHRQLGCWPACGWRAGRVAGRDDDARLPQLCRLSLPGLTTALPGRDDRAFSCPMVHPMRQTVLGRAQAAIWICPRLAGAFLPHSPDVKAGLAARDQWHLVAWIRQES